MQLRTYTRVLRVERRLYNWYDKKLPINPTWTQLGVFVAVGVPLWLVLRLLGVGLAGGAVVLWVMPPVWAAWAVSTLRVEGKSIIRWVRSQIRFLSEVRLYHRLAPAGPTGSVAVAVEVWAPEDSQDQLPSESSAPRRTLGLRPPRHAPHVAGS